MFYFEKDIVEKHADTPVGMHGAVDYQKILQEALDGEILQIMLRRLSEELVMEDNN